MAEWTGRRRTINSIIKEGDPPEHAASSPAPPSPEAPGATDSPQRPGATPDDPDLPGRERGDQEPLSSTLRPLTEYGTAQRILRMFTPAPGVALEAADWEQGPSSFEERRKVDPALLTPFRPLSGYGLGLGRSAPAVTASAPEEIQGIDEAAPAVPPTTETQDSAPAVSDRASEVPAGAIRGDGSAVCPPGFPIKGNAHSRIYHTSASRSYERTVAEICFSTPEAAEAAGYRAARDL